MCETIRILIMFLSRKQFIRSWTAGALALVFAALAVLSASAHLAQMVKSDPEAEAVLPSSPARVMAWFSEELVTSSSTIKIFNNQGEQIDKDDGGVDLDDPDHASMKVSLPANLPNGAYIVRWHALLTDGDPTDGSFNFYVGDKVPINNIVAAPLVSSAGSTSNDSASDAGQFPLGTAAAGLVLLMVVGLGIVMLTRRQPPTAG